MHDPLIHSFADPYLTLCPVCDDHGTIIDFVLADANDAATTLNRVSHDEYVGSRLLTLFPSFKETGVFDGLIRTLSTGEPFVRDNFSFYSVILNGERFANLRAVRYEGMIRYSWLDVTEQHELLDHFQLLAENASDVVFLTSADLIVTWVSPAVVELIGLLPEEVRNKSVVDLIHPDDLEELIAVVAATEGNTRNTARARVLTATGEYRWVFIWGKALTNDDDVIVGYVGNVRDYESEHAALEALEDSENRYRLLAEHASDIVIEINGEHNIRWISPSVRQVLGWRPDELVGLPSVALLCPDDAPPQEHWWESATFDDGTPPQPFRFRTASGDLLWMSVSARDIRDEDGHAIETVVSLRDCQEEVLARRALSTLTAGSRGLIHAHDEQDLLKKMCDIAVQEGGYHFAWYARRVNNETRDITKVAMSEEHKAYLDSVDISWNDEPRGQGPTGRALRTGETVVTNDIRTDERFKPWHAIAEAHGMRSSVVLPVIVAGEIDGSLNVYAAEPEAFDDFAVAILGELAAEIGYGIRRLRDEELLTRSLNDRKLLSSAIEQAAESILVCGPEGDIIYANAAAIRTSGYSLGELVGANPRILKSGLQDEGVYRGLWSTLSARQTWHGILINRRKNGDLYEEDTSISSIHDVNGNLIAHVAVKHDLTNERRLEADLSREHDDRVAIVNVMRHVRARATLEETAEAFCSAVTRLPNTDAAIVMLRDANDELVPVATCGTNVFEATRMRSLPLRNHDLVDNLLVGPVELSMNPADWTVNPQLVRAAIDEGVLAIVTASIRWEGEVVGILVMATKDPDAAEAASGRLDYFEEVGSFASTVIGPQASEFRQRRRSVQKLREIIDEHKFEPVFQPFVDLDSGLVVGYEALSRFDDGIPPDRRFNEAHEWGLGSELERVCAEGALEAASKLESGVFLSLNFSPLALLDGSAAKAVLDARRPLVIEITEHARIDDYVALRRAIDQIDGALLAVDDAGAGYTSLSHILELRPNFVKLDASIVRDIDKNAARQAMAAGLCYFAAQSGTVIIAEGIETQAEAETLRRLGAKLGRGGILGQGYFFAKPMPFPA